MFPNDEALLLVGLAATTAVAQAPGKVSGEIYDMVSCNVASHLPAVTDTAFIHTKSETPAEVLGEICVVP